MSAEIASAFVRIRPNMAGFQSEVQTGVTSSLSRALGTAAKIAGIGFGAKIAVDFTKGIVDHAADLQKQSEAITSEFGKAGEAIKAFGEKGGSALGLSAHQVDTTAARFGILFKNLGIGPELAAKMTVNFEKLAGSISQIRNVDPAAVLQNLPLAVAGNLRSLKQLGIAVDQGSLKVAAFKLGLTQSITQGLTPAQRAIAIYALATAHLGEFQAQAQSHSHDLANEERRLRAEWDNAKDSLGKGLLPKISDLVHFLGEHLPGALEKTKTAFHQFGQLIEDATAPVGGLKKAVEGLLGTFAVVKMVAFATAIKSTVIAVLAGPLATQLAVTKAEIVSTFTTAELLTYSWAAAIKTALISTGIGALVVALGFAASYAVTHWSKVRAWFEQFGAWLRGQHWFQTAIQDVEKLYTRVRPIIGSIVSAFESALPYLERLWRDWGATVLRVVKDYLTPLVAIVEGVLLQIRGAINVIGGLIHGDWSRVWRGLGEIVKGVYQPIVASAKAIGDAVAAVFENMWKDIELIFLEGVQKLIGILAKIPSVHIHVPGTGTIGFINPFKGINDSLQTEIDKLKQHAADAKKAGAQLKKSLADVSTNQGADSAQAAKQAQDAMKSQIDLIKGLQGQYQNVVAASDSGVKKIKGQLVVLNQSLGDAIKQENTDLQQAVQQARDNLTSIGQTLEQTIGQFLDKPIADAQNKISALANRRSLENLRASVILPGGKDLSKNPQQALAQLQALAKSSSAITRGAIQDFIVQYQGAVLAVKQDQVTNLKDRTTQRINDLADSYTRGTITFKQFQKGILKVLTADHISYRKAGALLGSAFANGFQDQVKGLLAQAAINAKFSGVKGPATQVGTVSLIQPLDAIKADQKTVVDIQRQIRDKHGALQARIAKATEKQAELLGKISAVKLGPTSQDLAPGRKGKKGQQTAGTKG